jgi:hypothetical protein
MDNDTIIDPISIISRKPFKPPQSSKPKTLQGFLKTITIDEFYQDLEYACSICDLELLSFIYSKRLNTPVTKKLLSDARKYGHVDIAIWLHQLQNFQKENKENMDNENFKKITARPYKPVLCHKYPLFS